jgi:hypothetical protein
MITNASTLMGRLRPRRWAAPAVPRRWAAPAVPRRWAAPAVRRRWTALTAAVVIGATGGAVAVVGPAAAAVPGLEAVSATLVASIDQVQSVTVSCPPGKQLISAGGYITGGAGAVTMDDLYPDPSANTVTVTGVVTDPLYGNPWRPTAVAYCANFITDLEWIDVRSPYDSANKFVTATCPSGKFLVGAGWSTEDAGGNVLVTGLVPKNGGSNVGADSVTVSAAEEAAFSDSWLITAFASCANLAGQNVVSTNTGHDSTDPKNLDIGCNSGDVATGGGASVISGSANVGDMLFDDMVPNNVDTGTAPTENTVDAYAEDSPGFYWTLKAYVLCADA